MYSPYSLRDLANAKLDDRRRATRQPSAWSEASATLTLPTWQEAWCVIVRWISTRFTNVARNQNSVNRNADTVLTFE